MPCLGGTSYSFSNSFWFVMNGSCPNSFIIGYSMPVLDRFSICFLV